MTTWRSADTTVLPLVREVLGKAEAIDQVRSELRRTTYHATEIKDLLLHYLR